MTTASRPEGEVSIPPLHRARPPKRSRAPRSVPCRERMLARARTGFLALVVVAVVTVVAFAPRDADGARDLGDQHGTRESASHALLAAPLDATGLPEAARSKGKRSADAPSPVLAFALVVVFAAFVDASY